MAGVPRLVARLATRRSSSWSRAGLREVQGVQGARGVQTVATSFSNLHQSAAQSPMTAQQVHDPFHLVGRDLDTMFQVKPLHLLPLTLLLLFVLLRLLLLLFLLLVLPLLLLFVLLRLLLLLFLLLVLPLLLFLLLLFLLLLQLLFLLLLPCFRRSTKSSSRS